MRIAYFGLPLGALLLLGDGHDVTVAALSRPAWPGSRRLVRRLGRDRVLTRPDVGSDEFLERLRGAAPDLVVSWFWTTRIPRRVLEVARLGGFGVHPSLLPRHRGPDPYYWAIELGDRETGVTAHRLDEEYDTGAIFGQKRMAVDPAWNAWTLARRLDRPSLALLRETARAFAEGRPPKEFPQDEALATQAPEPGEDDVAIRWDHSAERIARHVRALSPWPGASTVIGETLVTLVRVRATEQFPRALLAGEAAVRPDGLAVVRAGDSAVELLAGRDELERDLDTHALALLIALEGRREKPDAG